MAKQMIDAMRPKTRALGPHEALREKQATCQMIEASQGALYAGPDMWEPTWEPPAVRPVKGRGER